jgi:FkbM family methyltransferase
MNTNPPAPATTLDGFLDGRIQVEQPEKGYRAAIDPVLLASALQAQPGEHIWDIGAGVGTACLCLAHRRPDLAVTALEIDPDFVRLLQANIARNPAAKAVSVVHGDLFDRTLGEHVADHVITNPPFHDAAGTASADRAKAMAHQLSEADLAAWIKACLRLIRPHGSLTLILRADRLGQAVPAIARSAGNIAILPLWPKADQAAKRVLIRAVKASKAPLTLLPGMILHQPDGAFTTEAEAILRQAQALDWGRNVVN